MTCSEMIQNFRMHYDIVNLEGPGYEEEEILVFLNQAQVIEIMKEVKLRRWTWISNLIVNDVLTTGIPSWADYGNLRYVTPSEQYIGYVDSKSYINRTAFKSTTGNEWVGNLFITKERSFKYVNSTLNRVILIYPVVYEDENRTISIIHDGNTTFVGADDFALSFVHKPDAIANPIVNADRIANEILHERIVNTAVDLGKKVFNPQESGVSQQTDKLMDQAE